MAKELLNGSTSQKVSVSSQVMTALTCSSITQPFRATVSSPERR
jgi:hypothetical protein